ncbi:unnamed protein product (macronuclear) [Paramecium tetraurelia]|uniref:Transmembrane protein n=1 Tax=Paramecium tetraurelia TaxID=5888 RepID=A0BHI7_PARTE|nr:uncharacterized protein GSPATT00029039001 [Paramecium tetraurelia]CAK58004.1 unnamed protein product [Paramecium tetraurelia]|eukprot:XP_001425402.1 hypothetical protein (macronuclear) [Paramecium tetraurelia strain d4-2]
MTFLQQYQIQYLQFHLCDKDIQLITTYSQTLLIFFQILYSNYNLQFQIDSGHYRKRQKLILLSNILFTIQSKPHTCYIIILKREWFYPQQDIQNYIPQSFHYQIIKAYDLSLNLFFAVTLMLYISQDCFHINEKPVKIISYYSLVLISLSSYYFRISKLYSLIYLKNEGSEFLFYFHLCNQNQSLYFIQFIIHQQMICLF